MIEATLIQSLDSPFRQFGNQHVGVFERRIVIRTGDTFIHMDLLSLNNAGELCYLRAFEAEDRDGCEEAFWDWLFGQSDTQVVL